jgi:putative ABC transport system permease protein
MLRAALSRVLATFRRRRLDDELNEEVRLHIEMLAERFIGRGMDPAEAYYAARRQFGGVTQMKEDLRERRALPPLDVLVQDVRHAFRQLRKARAFTASAALTLALGIGATTAVFAVLDAVVLRPLPYAQPDRLMAVNSMDRRGTPHPNPISYPNFFDFRSQNRAFSHLVSYRDSRFTLTDTRPAIQVIGQIVSWDLFPLLGVQPELGRGFLPEEEKPGTHVVVLSHALWKSRFGGDRGILGHPVRINGRAYTVVGIAPPDFQFPLEIPGVQLWTSLSEDATVFEFTPLSEQRDARVLDAIGRLKPGITAEQARAQMDQVAGGLARLYPDANKNVATTQVKPELERLTGSSRKPLWILLGAVALVLLIACANVANLLLARSTGRVREFALRMALGASRAAVVRQLLIESLALGLIGCAGGVLLALAALRAVLPLAGDSIPRLSQAGINGPVLMFSTLAALVTSVLFSTAPAMRAAGTDPAGRLKDGARGIALGHNRLRNILVVVQVALGLMLLVGAESLMGSFLHLARRDPGFRADHLLTFGIGMPDTHYTTAATVRFSDRLRERLREIPGVQAVATGFPLPLEGEEMSVSFDIEKRPVPPPERPTSLISIVTPGFFSTLGIALRQGRDFTERDDAAAPRVLVVNEAFARKFFPGEEALGKRIMPGATNGKEEMQMREIVGIVENARQDALGVEPDPIYYFPYKQLSWDIGTNRVADRRAAAPDCLCGAASAGGPGPGSGHVPCADRRRTGGRGIGAAAISYGVDGRLCLDCAAPDRGGPVRSAFLFRGPVGARDWSAHRTGRAARANPGPGIAGGHAVDSGGHTTGSGRRGRGFPPVGEHDVWSSSGDSVTGGSGVQRDGDYRHCGGAGAGDAGGIRRSDAGAAQRIEHGRKSDRIRWSGEAT